MVGDDVSVVEPDDNALVLRAETNGEVVITPLSNRTNVDVTTTDRVDRVELLEGLFVGQDTTTGQSEIRTEHLIGLSW